MNEYQRELDMLTKTAGFTSDVLQVLVDRAMPMKLNEETTTAKFIDDHPITVMIYRCAKCGGRVYPRDGDLYCSHCGQALCLDNYEEETKDEM